MFPFSTLRGRTGSDAEFRILQSRAFLSRKVGGLLGPQLVSESTGREVNVGVRDGLILPDVHSQPAALRDRDGQEVFRLADLVRVDKAVAGEATHAVEDFSGL